MAAYGATVADLRLLCGPVRSRNLVRCDAPPPQPWWPGCPCWTKTREKINKILMHDCPCFVASLSVLGGSIWYFLPLKARIKILVDLCLLQENTGAFPFWRIEEAGATIAFCIHFFLSVSWLISAMFKASVSTVVPRHFFLKNSYISSKSTHHRRSGRNYLTSV